MGAGDSKFIHVAFPDGKVRLYDQPFPVAKLLESYPNHYITTVPIRQVCNWAGCHNQLLSDQMLEPGNLYFLKPVPGIISYEPAQSARKFGLQTFQKSNSCSKRKAEKKKVYPKRASVMQCYTMLSCIHPQTSPIHLAIAARMQDQTSRTPTRNPLLKLSDEMTSNATSLHPSKVLPVESPEARRPALESRDGEDGMQNLSCEDSEDTKSEDSTEGNLEFLHQQLQLYGVSRPTGLDMRLSYKWKPALPSIVEFADLPPKFQQKLYA